MAKLCLYCGQPLAKEDARFCNECGHAQNSFSTSSANPASANAGSGMIKVKLPPKELLPEENVFAQSEKSRPNQASPGTTHAPQREPSTPPSSRLPRRPVRLTTQESTAARELPGKLDEAANATRISGNLGEAPALPTSSAHSETTLPKPSVAEEASTMVLTGWREELERVRKEQKEQAAREAAQAQGKPTATTEATPRKPVTASEADPVKPSPASPSVRPARTSSVADELAWPPQSLQSTRPEMHEKPTQPKTPQKKNATESAQDEQETTREKIPTTEQQRRELHVKVWEQEATMQFPHVSVTREQPGPAPAVEHTPFANSSFDTEKQAEQIAQIETMHWDALPQTPAPSSKSQEPVAKAEPIHWETVPQTPTPTQEKPALARQKENRQPLAEDKRPLAGEKQSTGDDIEDLPTAHIAVPESMQIKPGVTVERTSTPAPTSWAASTSEEVEDQPTRPIPASALPPRSSIPPTTPQRDQQQNRPTTLAAAANPASLAGLSAGPAQTPNTFGAEGTRGQAGSSQAPIFDPTSLPPLPLNPPAQSDVSQPGFSTSSVPQRSGESFTQRSTPFASPGTSWPGTSSTAKAEENKPSKKKRASGKKVFITLLVLIVLGAGGWFAYYQYSSGGAQAYQSFSNNTLGVALSYPQSWKVTINQGQTSAHFADSTRTDQITLSTTTANGQQFTQYLVQESTQLGITGTPKATSLTFGGTSWQKVQSNVVQKGVTYTLTLYVTEHNNRFYALILQAPPTAYAQLEQVDFKPLRSSFNFL